MAHANDSQWTSGLCDCGGCGPCLGAFCCFTCFVGRTAHRLQHFPKEPEESGFNWCNTECCVAFALSWIGVPCIQPWMKRTAQRKKFGIKGSSCGDFWTAFCCMSCAIAQQEKDLKVRAEKERLLLGYGQQQQGMEYRPQMGH